MTLRLALATLALVPLAACGNGNSGNTLVLAHHVSIGQELLDLQEAHRSGALTDQEYAAAKENILAMTQRFEMMVPAEEYASADDAPEDE